jgi:hypothetical protein
MKKTFSILAVICTALLVSAAIPDPPHMPKRLPKVAQTGKQTVLTLAPGKTAVVVAPEANGVTRHAAREMAAFLGKILNCKIEVFSAPQKDKANIFIGFNTWTAKAGIVPAKHHRDAFTIKVTKAGVFIAGRDADKIDPVRNMKGGVWGNLYERASVFGVYDFLERFAGCRFYFPGELGVVLPAKKSLALKEATVFDYPDFITRKVSYYEGAWPGKAASDLSRNEKNLASHY